MRKFTNKVFCIKQFFGMLLVLSSVLSPFSLCARELMEQEIQAAVQTWVRYVTADARPDAVIERLEPYEVNGKTVAYIAYLMGGGFCLGGLDDLVLPVYLYNPKGPYAPDNPNYQYVLWEIATRTEELRKISAERMPDLLTYEEVLTERALYWQELIAGTIPKRAEVLEYIQVDPASMELRLTSQWHQNGPYNNQCPLHVQAGQRTLVGCVATAMAQIMYYWKWPVKGIGQSEVVNYNYRWRTIWDTEPLINDPNIPGPPLVTTWVGRLDWVPAGAGGNLLMNGNWDDSVYRAAQSISNDIDYLNALNVLYGRLNSVTTHHSVDFGADNTSYYWEILEDTHPASPDGDAEVAEICYHAGLSIEMGYGILASSAYTSEVPIALSEHFQYHPDGIYEARNINTMTEEILWLRPLEIDGCNANNECHAWIAYGYNKATDPNRQFLLNMGWGPNTAHVWFTLDSLNLGWINFQHHATRLAPLNVRFVGGDNPGDGSPDDPHENIEEAIAEAQSGDTLIFKAGSVNTFSSATLVINKPLTLKGHFVTIQ